MSAEQTQDYFVPVRDNSNTLDSTQQENDPLILRDGGLMGGITTLSDTNSGETHLHDFEITGAEDGDQDGEPMSFDPSSPEQFFNSHTDDDENETSEDGDDGLDGLEFISTDNDQESTPDRVARLIGNLGNAQWRTREGAQQEIQRIGPAALPQLFQTINNPPDLETRRRAEHAAQRIVSRMSTEQLLDMRDPAQRQQLVRDGVPAPLNANDAQRLGRQLETAAAGEMESRLRTPSWVEAMDYQQFEVKRLRFDQLNNPTEETIRQYDRMATQEGRNAVNERMRDLTQMLGSQHITEAERETIHQQISQLARVTAPSNVANQRVDARQALAQQIQANGGDQNRVNDLMLEADSIARETGRGGVSLKTILHMGLDGNAQFMQRFEQQAGNQAAQELRVMREQWNRSAAEMRQMENNGGNKKPKP